MNESSCICICFAKLYFFYWLSVVSLAFFIAVPFVFSRSWTSLAGVLKMPPVSNTFENYTSFVHSNTQQLATGWPYRWFWIFFSGFAKSPRLFRSSWLLNECNFYFKIDKYYILSEVCMMKTAPHGTVSPQMWCIKSIKGWFTRPRFVSKIL